MTEQERELFKLQYEHDKLWRENLQLRAIIEHLIGALGAFKGLGK